MKNVNSKHCPTVLCSFFRQKNRNGQGIIALKQNEVSFLLNFLLERSRKKKEKEFHFRDIKRLGTVQ